MPTDGLLVVDKPWGVTSFDVIRHLRRASGTRSIGHTGTLDPNATGVLCAVFGWGLRLIRFLPPPVKVYRATCRLGVATDTLDSQGRILSERPVTSTAQEIREALRGFVGSIMQTPPAYSAIKTDGVRAYRRARRGEVVELPPRPVQVHAMEVEGIDLPELTFHVTCGEGTFIRSICRDLGEILGCGAHLAGLRRLREGDYGIEQALSLDEIDALIEAGESLPLVPPERMLPRLPWLEVSAETVLALRQGKHPTLEEPPACPIDGPICVRMGGDDRLLAVVQAFAEPDGELRLRPIRVRAV